MVGTVVEPIFCSHPISACEPTDVLVGAPWAMTYSYQNPQDKTEDTKRLKRSLCKEGRGRLLQTKIQGRDNEGGILTAVEKAREVVEVIGA